MQSESCDLTSSLGPEGDDFDNIEGVMCGWGSCPFYLHGLLQGITFIPR